MVQIPRTPIEALQGKPVFCPPFDGEADLDASSIGLAALQEFKRAIGDDKASSSADWAAFKALFASAEDSFYKDGLSLTFDKRTLRGTADIAEAWSVLAPLRGVHDLRPADPARFGPTAFMRRSPMVAYVQMPFEFDMAKPAAHCAGMMKLVRTPTGEWKIWTLYTQTCSLHGSPFKELPLKLDEITNRTVERGKATPHGLPPPDVYDAVVIGGGHQGISTIIEMELIGLNAILCEKDDRIGTIWRNRYESLHLHVRKQFCQLPRFPYSKETDVLVPAKEVAQYYSDAVEKLKLPVYTGTQVVQARFDKGGDVWNLIAVNAENEQVYLKAKNLVNATGIYFEDPNVPDIVDQNLFKGEVLHSSSFVSGAKYSGKHAVVVGTCCSGCDVAADLVKHGAASVTMVQRSPTLVVQPDLLNEMLGHLFNDDTPIQMSDFRFAADPTVIASAGMSGELAHRMAEKYPTLLDDLERKGFKVQRGGALLRNIYEKYGGHVLDTYGALQLILDGKVEVKNGAPLRFTEEALVLDDGTTKIPADVVVLATGYKRNDARDMLVKKGVIEKDVADSLLMPGYGVDQEGELVANWVDSGHPRFYFTGFGLQDGRAYAYLLALQIKLALQGPLPPRYPRKWLAQAQAQAQAQGQAQHAAAQGQETRAGSAVEQPGGAVPVPAASVTVAPAA